MSGDEAAREEYIRRRVAEDIGRIPPRYRTAQATIEEITRWAGEVIAGYNGTGEPPPSLFLNGPTGTGKTWQGFGAVKMISAGGLRVDPSVNITWKAITVPDLMAKIRPGAATDPEGVFRQWRDTPLLLLDDIGAHKGSEWTEEQLYRLIDRRSAYLLPTIYVSNLPPGGNNGTSLETALSARVLSRIGECRLVVIDGPDRRLPPSAS